MCKSTILPARSNRKNKHNLFLPRSSMSCSHSERRRVPIANTLCLRAHAICGESMVSFHRQHGAMRRKHGQSQIGPECGRGVNFDCIFQQVKSAPNYQADSGWVEYIASSNPHFTKLTSFDHGLRQRSSSRCLCNTRHISGVRNVNSFSSCNTTHSGTPVIHE